MFESVDKLIADAKDPRRQKAKARIAEGQRDLTKVKYEQTQKRLLEIELKIQKLLEEKENLERKQKNREKVLENVR